MRGSLTHHPGRSLVAEGAQELDRMKAILTPSVGLKTGRYRVYDSVKGKTCHWCRQKTVEDHVQCSLCVIRFCSLCLKNRHGEDILLEMQEGNAWVCPKCRGGCGTGCNKCCNCGPCRKVQGLECTGMIVHLARAAGFTNVHDYLIFKTTGESPLEIARRKVGRGWCRSVEYLLLAVENFGPATQSSALTQATTHEQLGTTSDIFHSSNTNVGTNIVSSAASFGEDTLSKWDNRQGHIERLEITQSCPTQQQNRKDTQQQNQKDSPSSSASSQVHGFIRKRNTEPGVRVVGCRIYDSMNGKTCHWCRQKTLEDHVHCSYCTNKFCGLCLKNRHGEEIMLEIQEGNAWICPKCRNGCGPGCNQCCNCGRCRKIQGLEATGTVVHLARSAGFTNVHDYLIFKITGESPREISCRKKGRGWCKSADHFWSRPEEIGPASQSSLVTDSSREYTPMRGSMSKEQVKQLPGTYSYLLPKSYRTEEKFVKALDPCSGCLRAANVSSGIVDSVIDNYSPNDPTLSSSMCSTLFNVEPARASSVSEYTQNPCIDSSKTFDPQPYNSIVSPSKTSVQRSNQEESDKFSNLEPVVNRDPNISGSESLAKMKLRHSFLWSVFGRAMNDTIWDQRKDFEIPLEFRAWKKNLENTGDDVINEVDSDLDDGDYKLFMENAREKFENTGDDIINGFDSDLDDEDYKLFLQNVRVDGLSYALEFKINNKIGCTTSIKYEETGEGWDINGRGRRCERLRTFSEYRKFKFGLPRWRPKLISNFRNINQKPKCNLDQKEVRPAKRKSKLEASVASERQNKGKRRLMHQGDSKSEKLPCTANVPTDLMDGRKSNLQYNNQQIVKEEVPSPRATSPSSVPTVGNTDCRGIPLCIQSDDFKKNLKATLQEPFNTQQLHEMWNAVNNRKPIVRLRHTRQRTVQVETNEEGFSYLDYHPDLARSIAAATAPEEKLSLLRGFFFWLKHASWPGAFQPWVSSLVQKGNTHIDDDDDCVEMDGPDCEVVAVLLSVDDRRTTTSFPGKEQLLHPPLIEVKKEQIQTHEDSSKMLLPMNIEVKEEIATY